MRTAFRASAKFAKVLVGVPHFVSAHCTIGSLDEYTTAPSAVAITASSRSTATRTMWLAIDLRMKISEQRRGPAYKVA